MMRPAAARVAARVSRAGGSSCEPFGVHGVVAEVVYLDGLKGAGADVEGDFGAADAGGVSWSRRAGVKCRPAVGAATAPGAVA